MPLIEFELPMSLIRDIHRMADYQITDTNTFIVWAVAEKVGELKNAMIEKIFRDMVRMPKSAINRQEDDIAFEPLSDRSPLVGEVTPLENSILHIVFINGIEGDCDLKPLIARGGVFSALADQTEFNTVKVSTDGDYIEWAGEITIGSDTLYREVFRTKN